MTEGVGGRNQEVGGRVCNKGRRRRRREYYYGRRKMGRIMKREMRGGSERKGER